MGTNKQRTQKTTESLVDEFGEKRVYTETDLRYYLFMQIEDIKKGLDVYKCDFNWDFKANKEKHKNYIALEDIYALLAKVNKRKP